MASAPGTVYPVAAGYTDLSARGYKPTIYAKKLLLYFYTRTVLTSITNTEHEGVVKNMGDTVRVRTLPGINIDDYIIGQGLKRQTPNPGWIDLPIDKGKAFSLAVNDLDVQQSDIAFQDLWSAHAFRLMKIAIDRVVLGTIYAQVHAANTGATAGLISGNIDLGATGAPKVVTADNVIQYIVSMGTVLDEQEIDDEGRFLAIPSWMNALIKLSDIKNASLTGDAASPLRNGRVGEIDRFTVFRSNNLYVDSDGTNCLFGTKDATTFATQMTKTRAVDNPDDFGVILQGLQAYGFKVMNPPALGRFLAVAA